MSNLYYSYAATLVMFLTLSTQSVLANQTTELNLWNGLRSGHYVALMRHALAPGVGDPAHFKLNDCSTQRNLSVEGRNQAQRIGNRFRQNAIQQAQVMSSQWCRCLETARLLDLGSVNPLPALNSFFRNSDQGKPQTQTLKAWLAQVKSKQPLVMVTHQVNITTLTGIFPESGELVIIERPTETNQEVRVIGTVQTDY